MARDYFVNFDPKRVPSPCFVVDEVAIEDNLKILDRVQQESGAKILLALKAFSMHSMAPLILRYLHGTCASGIFEARLGREAFGGPNNEGEVHTFCVGYREPDMAEILEISDHVVFNSFSQWQRFKTQAMAAVAHRPHLKFGLRINPMHSEGATPLYDPCAPGSRLGIPLAAFSGQSLDGISGLHFHTLCEQQFQPLKRTVAAVEEQFGQYLDGMEWINFGGGHHITREGYEVDALIKLIRDFQQRYQVQVYLEPGEAIALYAGVLVSEVVDLTHNAMDLAIMDTSATCHMPDVLEMPYRPEIRGAGTADEKPNLYRLGGQSCLAGDVIGDYSFAEPLRIGQRLVFDEMAYYTMVKTNTFNGVPLPAIAIWNSDTDDLRVVKEFSYQDFRDRLS